MTAAELKSSPLWPKDIGETEDIVDKYCPLADAWILTRDGMRALFITSPGATEIKWLKILPFKVAQDAIGELLEGSRKTTEQQGPESP